MRVILIGLITSTSAFGAFDSGGDPLSGVEYRGFPYSLANFVEPAGWNVGDVGSTHQEWDVMFVSSGNTPDISYVTNPGGLPLPTLDVRSPGFPSGSGNFYAFGGNYSAFSDIFNHVGYGPSFGTHVIVQTSATMNPDSEAGGPASVFLDALEIVDTNGSPIDGGSNGMALRADVIWQKHVGSTFGAVILEELTFEFYLPGFTGDFRVQWDEIIHSSFDQLRVDTMVSETSFAITVLPDPVTGDYDGDGDVDLDDHLQWEPCMTGPAATYTDLFCERFDFNADGDVDLQDYVEFTALIAAD